MNLAYDEAQERFQRTGRNATAWADVAEDLHRAATVLWERIDTPDAEALTDWMVSCGKVAMMLEGLAIETLAKALLVKRNPGLVEDGRWKGTGHHLLSLAQEVGLSPLAADEEDLLSRLEAFVRWAGRYPIPLDAQEWTPTWTGNSVQLAPGTYYSTADRDRSESLIARLRAKV